MSKLGIPNAFAFGRTKWDASVCVTEEILCLLNEEELRAVLGHEISHIKHHDVALITLLSIFPLVIYYIAWGLMQTGRGSQSQSGEGGGNPLPLIGLGMLLLYFLAELLVLYGSRIREYYADLGSIKLGARPRHLATALYKLT